MSAYRWYSTRLRALTYLCVLLMLVCFALGVTAIATSRAPSSISLFLTGVSFAVSIRTGRNLDRLAASRPARLRRSVR